MEEMVLTHKWQEQGVGKAPFTVLGAFELPSKGLLEANPDAYNNAMRMIPKDVGAGTCEVCGQAIMANFLIRDAEGKRFVVGCDCVMKTGDTRLMPKAHALELKMQREKRRAKKLAAQQARFAAREAKIAAEREANGGLTNYELAQKIEREARAAEFAAHKAANAWLLEVLVGGGGFIMGMREKLETTAFTPAAFTPRMIEVLREIYAKAKGGRPNAKAYKEAVEYFDGMLAK